MNTGMLIGDAVSLPWSDRIHQSRQRDQSGELAAAGTGVAPADVGELVSDQMGHMWWTSLLRNLADRVAPERLPPLQLTSKPVDADLKSGDMQLARWSSLITLPKVPLAERQFFTATPARAHAPRMASAPPLAGFAGMSSGPTRCASTCPSWQAAERSFAIAAEGRSSDRAGSDGGRLLLATIFGLV